MDAAAWWTRGSSAGHGTSTSSVGVGRAGRALPGVGQGSVMGHGGALRDKAQADLSCAASLNPKNGEVQVFLAMPAGRVFRV
eukprot:126248-Chlamydomonas_euryale.AAC.9